MDGRTSQRGPVMSSFEEAEIEGANATAAASWAGQSGLSLRHPPHERGGQAAAPRASHSISP